MHRFFVPHDQFDEHAPLLTGSEAHHAARVRRVAHGEIVAVFDGQGAEWKCTVEIVEKTRVRLRLVERRNLPPPRTKIILAQSLLPHRAMEFVIEKATELGATAIIPLATQRTVATVKKSEVAAKRKRWRGITIESAKQCGVAWLPVVETPRAFTDFLEEVPPADLKFIAALDQSATHPRKVFTQFAERHGHKPTSAVIAIGPEGDFTTEEVNAAVEAGFVLISLGTLTLRSETAAVYALSVLNYELQPSGLNHK